MLKLVASSTVRELNFRGGSRRISGPWARCYGDGPCSNVVHSPYEDCEIPNCTVTQRFFEQASKWPNKVAMECGITSRRYTYDQLGILTRRFGSALARMGCKQGDVMGILLPNVLEYPIAMFGASGVGMPVTLINPIYTVDEILQQCKISGASVLIGVPLLAPKMVQVARKNPSIRRMILIGDYTEGFVSMGDMLMDSGDLFDENVDVNPSEDVFVLPNSSGTGGPPKTIMTTHENILVNVQQALHPALNGLRTAEADAREHYLGVLPFHHTFGLCGQLLTSFESGGRVIALPRFEPKSFLNAIDNTHPTVLYVAPQLVGFLAATPSLKMKSFSRTRVLFCGGASMAKDSAMKLLERFRGYPLTLREGYGLTETSPAVHFSLPDNLKIGSVGPPLSRTKSKVVDIETGAALGANQRGELCVMGPQVMKGYLNNPDATKQAIDSSGWLHTGDIAYYDEDGDFYVVDRLKELIKVKGFQVSPTELEELLMRHPAVADAAVIGVPDEYAGEVPRACIRNSHHTNISTAVSSS